MPRGERKRFSLSSLPLRRKVVAVLCVSTALLFVFGAFSMLTLYRRNLEATYNALTNTNELMTRSANSYFNALDAFTISQFYNPSIYAVMDATLPDGRLRLLDALRKDYETYSYNHIRSMRTTVNLPLSCYFFIDEDHFLRFPFSYQRNDAANRAVYLNSKSMRTSSPILFPPSIGSPSVYIARSTNNVPVVNARGVIILCISEDALVNLYRWDTPPAESFLMDTSGVVFSNHNKKLLGATAPEYMPVIDHVGEIVELTLEGEPMLVTSQYTAWNRLLLVTSMPKSAVQAALWGQLVWYLQVTFIFLASGGILFLLLARVLTRFLNEALLRLGQVRAGDYGVRMPEYKDQDLLLFSHAFNSMAGEIQRLIDVVYRGELLQKDTEIKFLQAQMNPHFLFNVLTSIRTRAKLHGDETAYRMLYALGELLRAGMCIEGDQLATLDAELDYVEKYLFLQKMRFEDRLLYEIRVDEDVDGGCAIPRLCLEAIVENAVVHGIERKPEPGHIAIHARREGHSLVIDVTDDGVGFDTALLREPHLQEGRAGHSQIGVVNTQRRLKLMYGDAYGLSIESEPGVGTRVAIRIPHKEA